MPRIPLTTAFQICPEGEDIFRIYKAEYDETYGTLDVYMVQADGLTIREHFSLMRGSEPNPQAMNAFSYFAKTALKNNSAVDVDPDELIDCYLKCNVIHKEVESKKEAGKFLTFANIDKYESATGYEREANEIALKMGKTESVDLDELLNS